MATEIPREDLRYWSLTTFKDESGKLLFEIQHDSEIDWQQPDFKSSSMDEVFEQMK